MLERDVEAYLKSHVQASGGEVRKLRWIGRTGAPDRLVLLPGKHFLVELKKPGKHLDHHQVREKVRLQLSGFDVYEVSSFEAVDALL